MNTTSIERSAQRFATETANHQLTILHDDGHYRHLRFKQPANGAYWFDLITVPGSLIFRGDGESFVFAREPDMFGFFRSNPDRASMRVSPDYWAEKLTSHRTAARAYSREALEQLVADDLAGAEEAWPGVTAAWTCISDGWDDYDLEHEQSARQALHDFEFGATMQAECPCGKVLTVGVDDIFPKDWYQQHARHGWSKRRVEGFGFTRTDEWNLHDFDWWYLWACHAIVWGIARYDQAKATASTAPTLAVAR